MSGLPHSVKSFSISQNNIFINVEYTTLGNHFAIAFIQINSIQQLEKLLTKNKKSIFGEEAFNVDYFDFTKLRSKWSNGVMSVKSFGCPNFLFNMTFIS